jgi:hypothetical protein
MVVIGSGGGEVGQPPAQVRPHVLGRVEIGCVAGQRVDAQPQPPGVISFRIAAERWPGRPSQISDRCTKLLVRAVEQAGEVRLVQALRRAFPTDVLPAHGGPGQPDPRRRHLHTAQPDIGRWCTRQVQRSAPLRRSNGDGIEWLSGAAVRGGSR